MPLAPKPTSTELVQAKLVPDTGPVKAITGAAWLLQFVRLTTVLTVADGLTSTVNERGVPGHPLAVGVTVTVAVRGAVPVFLAV